MTFCFLKYFKGTPNYFDFIYSTAMWILQLNQRNLLLTPLYIHKLQFISNKLCYTHTLKCPLKSTCSFNRPWCPSFNRIRALTDLFINNFVFQWSPHFFLFEPPNKNPQKKTHAISAASHHPSIPWNKSRRQMNPVTRNYFPQNGHKQDLLITTSKISHSLFQLQIIKL